MYYYCPIGSSRRESGRDADPNPRRKAPGSLHQSRFRLLSKCREDFSPEQRTGGHCPQLGNKGACASECGDKVMPCHVIEPQPYLTSSLKLTNEQCNVRESWSWLRGPRSLCPVKTDTPCVASIAMPGRIGKRRRASSATAVECLQCCDRL